MSTKKKISKKDMQIITKEGEVVEMVKEDMVTELLGTADVEEQVNIIKNMHALANARVNVLTIQYNWLTNEANISVLGELPDMDPLDALREILRQSEDAIRKEELRRLEQKYTADKESKEG